MSSSAQLVRYVVISPVRDEAQHLDSTIRAVTEQTIPPAQWILVDDGSTDGTASLIDHWAAEHSWIVPVHRPNRGRREAGSGVMEAFYDGLQKITVSDWDYIVKLDGDLSFDQHYFARCFEEFGADPKLGIGGGVICHEIEGRRVLEPNPQFHVRGATKIYRRACWQQIGGLIRTPGWDTMDEVKANQMGWRTRSFPSLQLLHYRITGGADGAWRNAVKNGLGSHICGFHPLFVLSRSVRRMFEKPYLVRSLGLLYGFTSGYLKQVPQVADKDCIRYLRQQQIRRLTFRPTIWR